MNKPRIYADFHNADWQSRLRLNCNGTKEDLMKLGVKLSNGLEVTLYQENQEIDGIVEFSGIDGIWVAKVDWLAIVTENSISI